jgi:ketosteroid isomerase-like protein
MFRWLLVGILFFLGVHLSANEPDHAIHEELRALIKGLEEAVNSEQYGKLHQYLHKDLRITMSNQEVLSSHEDVDKFFNFWFGPDGFLERVEMKLNADSLTELYADKTIGIVRGSGEENTYLSDSRFFPMKTRWTATVIKDIDGKWRVLTLHIGVNFLDNPILSVAEESGKYMAIAGALIGLFVGLLAGLMFWRKRRTTTTQ